MRGCGDAVHRTIGLAVDNIWISPDGTAGIGGPACDAAEWRIRNAGWVFVQRTPGRLGVVLDIRCARSGAVAAALDLLRAAPGQSPAVDRFDLCIHDAGESEQLCFADPLPACHHLLQCLERSDDIESLKLQLYRARVDRVVTERLPLSAIAGRSRLAGFLGLWQQRAGPAFPDGAAAALARDISVQQLDAGEPRLVSMGGGLLFGARDGAGARLEDLLPAAQAEQSRQRILQAARTGQPVLRRHRTLLYDVMILTVPVQRAGRQLTVSIAQRQELPAMPSVRTERTPRQPALGQPVEHGAAALPRRPAARSAR